MNGSVAHLWRHPIKSHGREELRTIELVRGRTMPWDRTWAIAHEDSTADGQSWVPCAHFSRVSKAPKLQAINAVLDETSEQITLSHPELPTVTLHPKHQQQDLIAWARPIMPENRSPSHRVVRVPDRGMTDTDFPSISLCNLASHRAVSERLNTELSPLRWRGNIWLDLADPWEEFGWVGKTIQVGSVELLVRERTIRCMATTANPDTGERDADTLGALSSGWGHTDFGVYAEVTKSGATSIGDKVEVLQ